MDAELEKLTSPNYKLEYDAFQNFLNTGKVSKRYLAKAILEIPSNLYLSAIQNLRGPVGYKLRNFYYSFNILDLGKQSFIDIGVVLSGPKNIKIGNFTWIDSYVVISALLGEISIGNNCHVAPNVVMGSRAPIRIGNRVGIGSGTKIYSNSEKVINNKFLAGPMIPESDKGFYTAPVIIEDDVMVGANTIILPGVTIGKGAVLGAGSIITKNVESWAVVIDRGKKIYERKPF
jgi:acetyltransferase-like isoleucine patch superfamily enzyme